MKNGKKHRNGLAFDPSLVETKARVVFWSHDHCYTWKEIVLGAPVCGPGGTIRLIPAVGRNTFRGFHRVDKTMKGAMNVFQSVFLDNEKEFKEALRDVRSEADLHKFENHVCNLIRQKLTNIRPTQLISYNKLRKPVDLYIENLVTMDKELRALRSRLVPLLFLPLDSQMLGNPIVFSNQQLLALGLRRGATYKDVTTEQMYLELQRMAKDNARGLTRGKNVFLRIYFDLLWNDRWSRTGNNLLELDPD